VRNKRPKRLTGTSKEAAWLNRLLEHSIGNELQPGAGYRIKPHPNGGYFLEVIDTRPKDAGDSTVRFRNWWSVAETYRRGDIVLYGDAGDIPHQRNIGLAIWMSDTMTGTPKPNQGSDENFHWQLLSVFTVNAVPTIPDDEPDMLIQPDTPNLSTHVRLLSSANPLHSIEFYFQMGHLVAVRKNTDGSVDGAAEYEITL
jgi:hypothetical protein